MLGLIRQLPLRLVLIAKNFLRSPSLASPDIFSRELIWQEIFLKRIYVVPQFGLKHGDPIDVVVDVGANIGMFTAWAASEYRCGKVVSYEASPVTFKYLVKNLEKLSRKNVATEFLPVNAAVSNIAEGTLTIFHRSDNIVASTLMVAGEKFGKGFEVQATTLSKDLTSKNINHVDLLKIDVEGHFMEVLEGIEDSFYPKIRNIVVEVDWVPQGAVPFGKVEQFLRDRGYHTDVDDRSKSNNATVYAYREQ